MKARSQFVQILNAISLSKDIDYKIVYIAWKISLWPLLHWPDDTVRWLQERLLTHLDARPITSERMIRIWTCMIYYLYNIRDFEGTKNVSIFPGRLWVVFYHYLINHFIIEIKLISSQTNSLWMIKLKFWIK